MATPHPQTRCVTALLSSRAHWPLTWLGSVWPPSALTTLGHHTGSVEQLLCVHLRTFLVLPTRKLSSQLGVQHLPPLSARASWSAQRVSDLTTAPVTKNPFLERVFLVPHRDDFPTHRYAPSGLLVLGVASLQDNNDPVHVLDLWVPTVFWTSKSKAPVSITTVHPQPYNRNAPGGSISISLLVCCLIGNGVDISSSTTSFP